MTVKLVRQPVEPADLQHELSRRFSVFRALMDVRLEIGKQPQPLALFRISALVSLPRLLADPHTRAVDLAQYVCGDAAILSVDRQLGNRRICRTGLRH